MYRSFKVKNFRCFEELTLDNLERVNLITGMNNIGKTALLEAIFLHAGAYNPELALRVNALRGIETIKIELGWWIENPWDSLFTNFDISKTIVLAGDNTLTGRRVMKLRILSKPSELAEVVGLLYHHNYKVREQLPSTSEPAKILELQYQQEGKEPARYFLILDPRGIRVEPVPPSPPFPAFFIASHSRPPLIEEAERFGKLEIQGKQDVMLSVLRFIDPRLKRLAMVVTGGVPVLHGDIGTGRLMPLPLMGEGMVRLARLILYISNAPNGVVLVDEFENGLHHSVLQRVWQAVGEVAREFDTQIFATTHSWECITAAHKAFSTGERYDFCLYRLERIGENIRAISYDKETLDAAIKVGLEVR